MLDDPTTVGTYLERQAADRAAAHLRDAGFDDVTVEQPVEPIWQVQVPGRRAHEALAILLRDEQDAIESY
jgi:hypothetical protein